MRPISHAGIVLVLVLAQPAAAGPTCALLDPEKVSQAALLEAKLIATPGITWVERADIDKVLQEQKLQALFSPQGVAERVKLGQLLKADLLVMVRPVKGASEPVLELVVSETATGLRLVRRAVPVTKDTDADVAALLAAARDGLRRHGETITEVVAVPPFVSTDLELTHEHLKGAFAKLAEVEALSRKGVVVVELAEAEALAKELALTAPGARPVRPLPVYLLGEYRCEGKGAERTVNLKLRAERGAKALGAGAEVKVRAGAESEAVRTWASDTLGALARDDRPRPPADPKVEARVLAARARTFKQLGNPAEALALTEASLLLDPDQPDLHADALRAGGKVMWPIFARLKGPLEQKGDLADGVRLYLRGLAHLEAYITAGRDPMPPIGTGWEDLYHNVSYSGFLKPAVRDTPAHRDAMRLMNEEKRAMCLRVIPLLVKQGKERDWYYVRYAVEHMSPREKYETIEGLLAQFVDQPGLYARTVQYVSEGQAVMVDTPEGRALLARLGESKNKDIQAAAGEIVRRMEAKRNAPTARYATDPQGRDKPGPGPGAVKFTPVALAQAQPGLLRPLRGILAAGASTDVLWTDESLYLMKEKGKIRSVWSAPAGTPIGLGFPAVCFDGKYVWATMCLDARNPILLAIDPGTEKVWELGAADGLPLAPEKELTEKLTRTDLMVTGLEPGRVCLVGHFLGRSWIGIGTLEAGKGTVKVFHEAREAQDLVNADQWKKATVTFNPTFLFTLDGPPGSGGKPARRVLVGRGQGTHLGALGQHPLVVDPERLRVEVLKDNLPGWPSHQQCYADGPTAYFSANGPAARMTSVFRIGPPDQVPEMIATRLPPSELFASRVFVRDGRVHAVLAQVETRTEKGIDRRVPTYQWWTADTNGKDLRQVATNLPGIRSVTVSSHYGLVALVEGPRASVTLHTVEIVRPEK